MGKPGGKTLRTKGADPLPVHRMQILAKQTALGPCQREAIIRFVPKQTRKS